MLRIAKSLITIAAVAAIAVGATGAYFSDDVKISGNSFATGTIDINVDGDVDDVNASYSFTDMKPGFIEDTDFVINNTGSNPANIYKQVDVTDDPGLLATVVDYTLSVKIPGVGGDWNQVLYNYNKTLAQIQGSPMFLGMLPAGASMSVTESYRMQIGAGNEFQDKTMTFDITVTAEQLKGTLVMENKTAGPEYRIIGDDAVAGTLTYGVMDKKFDFDFSGTAPLANTSYTLLMTDGVVWPTTGVALASGLSDGAGVISLSGVNDFGSNQINKKIWLIKTADWNGTNMTAWNSSSYLFETGLIDYYDSGV